MLLRKRNLNIQPSCGIVNVEGLNAKRKNVEPCLRKIELVEEESHDVDAGGSTDEMLVIEFDKETEYELSAFSPYAQEVFDYYKFRERFFKVGNYFPRQEPYITRDKRAMIVDWMVEMQETFELNHETLYLAVKLMDLYIDRVPSLRGKNMQLVACTALFISAKYDERSPPLIDDFIYMSKEQFCRDQMLAMEREMFGMVDYDIGCPLSYRFLRRLARVARSTMTTLTLARYILETSLMFFDFCRVSESLIAGAAYLLAVKMNGCGDWIEDLQTCSGYTRDQLEPMAMALNHMVIKRKLNYDKLSIVYAKYSHEIFHGVALINSLEDVVPFSHAIRPPNNHSFDTTETNGNA